MAAGSDARRVVETELAPAKVNLFLHVVGRRGDGYHLLESLVAFASIGDQVRVSNAPDLTLSISGPFADSIGGAEKDNLVYRAAQALQEAGSVTSGASIELQKNLPVAAGIGGGSADAAAALLALNRLWATGLQHHELEALALPLGADVPACLHRSPVMMRGIGEDLSSVPVPPGLGVVLANPLKPLPTPAVFADFRSYEPFAATGQHDWNAIRDRESWINNLHLSGNSLEPPARRLLPAVSLVIDAFDRLEGCLLSRMSGSGATCFALFDSWDTAARRADSLSVAHPDWWVKPGRLLS